MLEKLLLNLQLFADGGGDGGDGGSSSASVGEALGKKETGETEIPAFIPERAKHIYQKAVEKTKGSTTNVEAKADDNVQTTNEQPTTEDLSYADLIKSDKYKEEHEAYLKKTINERLKKYKDIEENLGKHKAMLDTVALKYGVNPEDENYLDTLAQKIEEDDSYYEQYAMEHDIDTQEARKIVTMERKAAQFDAQKEQMEKQEQMRQQIMQLRQNAEKTKNLFPNFDLETEMQNENFRRICAVTNGDTTAAFKACHHDEIVSNTLQMATRQIKNQTAQSISSNKARPIENGISSQAPSVVENSFKGMTLKELNEYRKKHFN